MGVDSPFLWYGFVGAGRAAVLSVQMTKSKHLRKFVFDRSVLFVYSNTTSSISLLSI